MGVVDGPIHRCRGQQAGRVWFTSRGNEGIREGGRFWGVYKRGGARRGDEDTPNRWVLNVKWSPLCWRVEK